MECFSCNIPMVEMNDDALLGTYFECPRCGRIVFPFAVYLSAPGHSGLGHGSFSTWKEAAQWGFEAMTAPGAIACRALIINRIDDSRSTISMSCQ